MDIEEIDIENIHPDIKNNHIVGIYDQKCVVLKNNKFELLDLLQNIVKDHIIKMIKYHPIIIGPSNIDICTF